MLQRAKQTEQEILALLVQWGDALLRLQIDMPGEAELDGGILCPGCKTIHGRCHEAVYPLLFLAQRTGQEAYLIAAKKVFQWGKNMLCADGSLRNDAKSDWRGITVFGAIALHDALYYHGSLLSAAEKAEWEMRLSRMGSWLYENLHPGKTQAYLNYYAANACAMALLGKYFGRGNYLQHARELAAFCFSHTSENLFLYGEGHPTDVQTAKGCFAIDAGGYNVEETLPALCRYAQTTEDLSALARCRAIWTAHLQWMLPDGAWDNSVGSRAFKWTYWGSRTSDGCQDALFSLGKTDPVFAEAALRNLELYRRCTHGGLLYGGPDYDRHGEKPCVHHTFCHAKTLAGCLNNGLYDFNRVPLPSENAPLTIRYPELDVLRIAFGGWLADISGYDYMPMHGAHACGGAISLLWHRKTGPVIACGASDYSIKEPQNQQLPTDPESHRCTCPRAETVWNGVRYAQHYDQNAKLSVRERAEGLTVRADAFLCDSQGRPLPGPGACTLEYTFTQEALQICCSVDKVLSDEAQLILPLVGSRARVTVFRGEMRGSPNAFFNLNPGFLGTEYTIRPDSSGIFLLQISV